MSRQYMDPANGSASDIGTQIRIDHFIKQALIELKKETYFGALADTTSMPKNMGKKIKRYQYIPMLDERNITDQGIDASGVTIATTEYFVTYPRAVLAVANASKADAATAINDNVDTTLVATAGADGSAGTGFATLTLVGPLTAKYLNATKKNAVTALNLGVTVLPGYGNLYGSSKDVGTIVGKLPVLSETGGRVNRVGFTRVELEGSLEKYGFFDEYTKESMDFDSDAELEQHINREMLFGANEITEDLLQIDLLHAADVVYFAGTALEDSDISGASGAVTEVTYGDLSRLSVELDNNRCPKQTKVISGSRMIDTRVIRGGRIMFIGSELIQTIEQMVDYFDNQAFIPVAHYADAGNVVNGEIGTVGQFRIVVVPEMMHFAGAGAAEGTNAGYRATNGRYDVFPMLVVGDAAFTTIGFQTSGNSVKFSIKHAKPESPEAYANDPYGETGFMSIKWYYGFMKLRGERIAVLKTVAKQ